MISCFWWIWQFLETSDCCTQSRISSGRSWTSEEVWLFVFNTHSLCVLGYIWHTHIEIGIYTFTQTTDIITAQTYTQSVWHLCGVIRRDATRVWVLQGHQRHWGWTAGATGGCGGIRPTSYAGGSVVALWLLYHHGQECSVLFAKWRPVGFTTVGVFCSWQFSSNVTADSYFSTMRSL